MADVFQNLGFEEDKAPQAAATPAQDPFHALGFEEEKAEPTTGEAFARQGLQGLTFGLADEAHGALHNPIGAAKALAGLLGKDVSNDADVADYSRVRDAHRAADAAAFKAHPYASVAGNIVGALPTAVLTGGLGEAAGVGGIASPFVRGAAQGALDAGIMGAGSSNADLAHGDVGGLAKDVGKSAATGGVVGGVLGKVAHELSPDQLAASAEDQAITHLRPTPRMKMALGEDRLRAAAREALDSGAIQAGTKADQTAANLDNLIQEVGAAKGDIVNNSTATINPVDIADEVQKQVIDPLRQTAAGQKIADNIEGQKAALLQQYGTSMTPAQLEAEKTAVQGNINYITDPNASQEAQRGYARILKEGSEDAIADPNFRRTKEAYGNLKNAQAMAERTGALTDGGGLMGHLTDVGVGTEALHLLANGNPAGMAVGAGRALTKGRVSSTLAVGMDKLSKILSSTPQVFGKYQPILLNAARRSPAALAATHFVLSQTNPDYRKTTEGLEETQP